MNKIDEYKNRIQWDIWEDIQWIDIRDIVWEKSPEELPHKNPNIPIKDHTLKRLKKT